MASSHADPFLVPLKGRLATPLDRARVDSHPQSQSPGRLSNRRALDFSAGLVSATFFDPLGPCSSHASAWGPVRPSPERARTAGRGAATTPPASIWLNTNRTDQRQWPTSRHGSPPEDQTTLPPRVGRPLKAVEPGLREPGSHRSSGREPSEGCGSGRWLLQSAPRRGCLRSTGSSTRSQGPPST